MMSRRIFRNLHPLRLKSSDMNRPSRTAQCTAISSTLGLAAILLLISPFCAWAGAVPNHPVQPFVTLTVNYGFCENSSRFPLVPLPGDPPRIRFWGQFCHVWEDPKTSFAQTSSFIAPKVLKIYSIGWTKSPTLSIQRVADGTKYLLVPMDEDLYRWSRSEFELPSDWQGKEVRLVAEGVPPKGLWRAFSEPLEGDTKDPQGDALQILGLTLRHFVQMLGCALAFAALAVVCGVRKRLHVGLVTLAATAVPGYCIFWLTIWKPSLSQPFATTLLFGALLLLLFCLWKIDREGRAILKSLLIPLVLIGAASLMVQASGFLYGGWQDPLNRERTRYLPRLPPDNRIPLVFAEGARLPHVPTPLQGDWLSSDRPPLQTGIVLAELPRLSALPVLRVQSYSVVSVLAQSFWIFALWLLLTALGLNPRAIALTLAACLFSGFVFLNTFFVWPKLLAAAYTLGFLAAFVEGRSRTTKQPWSVAVVVPGALLAFALLAHGGPIFALLPAVPLILLWRRPRPLRTMAAALGCSILLYLPWMLYQKFYDPPGDQLLKLHLAGVSTVDQRSFAQSLVRAYGSLSRQQIVDNKLQNFRFSFKEGVDSLEKTALLYKAVLTPGGLPEAAERGLHLREQIFFHPAPSMGLFLFAPLALLLGLCRKRFRTLEWRTAIVFWFFTLAATALWCLLMFGPSTTSVHQGAYATMLLAMAAGVLSLWAASPKLAAAVVLAQTALSFVLNEPLTRVPYPNGLLPEGHLHKDTLVLLCCSVVLVLGLLWRLAAVGEEEAQAVP